MSERRCYYCGEGEYTADPHHCSGVDAGWGHRFVDDEDDDDFNLVRCARTRKRTISARGRETGMTAAVRAGGQIIQRHTESVADLRRKDGLQVFPKQTSENVPESRESQTTPDGSGPIRNPQPTALPAPGIDGRPGFCPGEFVHFGMGRAPHIGWIVSPTGCHEFTGGKSSSGYGQVFIDQRTRPAHRVRYEREVGPVPPGMTLDHLCRNRGCCNPAHLEPVTNKENLARGEGVAAKNTAKTHCLRGHLLAGDNLIVEGDARRCRECRRARDRSRVPRRRALGVSSPRIVHPAHAGVAR